MDAFSRDQSILFASTLRRFAGKKLQKFLFQFHERWSGTSISEFGTTRNEIKKVITTACCGILYNSMCFGFMKEDEEVISDTQQFVASVTSNIEDEILLKSYSGMLRMNYCKIPINTIHEDPLFLVLFYDYEVPRDLLKNNKFLNYIIMRCVDRLYIEKIDLDLIK
jgi:hypothetical protein